MVHFQKIRVNTPRVTLEVNGFGMPVTSDWLRCPAAHIRDLRLEPGDMVRMEGTTVLHIWGSQLDAVRRGAIDQPPFVVRTFPCVELAWLTDPGRASFSILKWSETEGFYTS